MGARQGVLVPRVRKVIVTSEGIPEGKESGMWIRSRTALGRSSGAPSSPKVKGKGKANGD